MAKIVMRGNFQFLEIDKICSRCGKFNTCFEPILESTSETSKRFYRTNKTENCGNCGNYI